MTGEQQSKVPQRASGIGGELWRTIAIRLQHGRHKTSLLSYVSEQGSARAQGCVIGEIRASQAGIVLVACACDLVRPAPVLDLAGQSRSGLGKTRTRGARMAAIWQTGGRQGLLMLLSGLLFPSPNWFWRRDVIRRLNAVLGSGRGARGAIKRLRRPRAQRWPAKVHRPKLGTITDFRAG